MNPGEPWHLVVHPMECQISGYPPSTCNHQLLAMNWFFAVDGHSHGPVTQQKLAELARTGEVGTDTLVWHPGLEEWEPLWKLKADIEGQTNKGVMAQQARGTTERIPVADAAA